MKQHHILLLKMSALIFIFTALVLLVPHTTFAQAPTPTPMPPLPVHPLSDASSSATAQRLLLDAQNNLHVLWDNKNLRAGTVNVLHRQLHANGQWSDTVNLTEGFELVFDDSNRFRMNPAGNVCAFFNAAVRTTAPDTLGLYMRCLIDNVWTPPQFIKPTPGTHRDDFPAFAPDGSVKTLFLTGAGDLYFENVKLSDDQAAAYEPAFIIDSGGGYHAFWTRQGNEFTLMRRFSSDLGQTWGGPEPVTPPGFTSSGQMGVAAGTQGSVHVVWQTLNGKIIYRRLDPNTGWTEPVELQAGGASNSATNFGIAVSPDGLAAITWQGVDEIMYVEQRSDGTFTAPVGLGTAQSSGGGPQLAVSANGTRQFVWQQQTPNSQLFYATMASLTAAPRAVPNTGPEYSSPFFQNHIHDPSILISASAATLATNFTLAIILALAMGFFGNLLNDTLESNEERVAEMLGPFNRFVRRTRATTNQIENDLRARRLHWLTTFAKVTGLLLLLGIIYAFVDPAFSPTNPDALLAILALTLSLGLIGLVDDLAQYIFLRRHGETPALRVHAGNAVLAMISALGSRLFQITPGILVGSPAGIEDVRETKLDAYLHLIAMGAIAALALLAWFLSPLFASNLFAVTILLLIFGVGIQTLFFEMLPLNHLHGKSIFQFNRILWGAMLAVVAWLFISTMLNPDGEFLASFNQPNMVALAGLVSIFCLFSAGVWFYFSRNKTS